MLGMSQTKRAMDCLTPRAQRVLLTVTDDMRDDREIVLEAVKHSQKCFEFVSRRLRSDREVALSALCPRDAPAGTAEPNFGLFHNLRYIGTELQGDEAFLLEVARRCGLSIWQLLSTYQQSQGHRSIDW